MARRVTASVQTGAAHLAPGRKDVARLVDVVVLEREMMSVKKWLRWRNPS